MGLKHCLPQPKTLLICKVYKIFAQLEIATVCEASYLSTVWDKAMKFLVYKKPCIQEKGLCIIEVKSFYKLRELRLHSHTHTNTKVMHIKRKPDACKAKMVLPLVCLLITHSEYILAEHCMSSQGELSTSYVKGKQEISYPVWGQAVHCSLWNNSSNHRVWWTWYCLHWEQSASPTAFSKHFRLMIVICIYPSKHQKHNVDRPSPWVSLRVSSSVQKQ